METKVLIGVDPHKATNAVAVLDEHGELLERAEFSADRKGLRVLEHWARCFPERRWAVEGANGLGRTLAHKLASAGEEVVGFRHPLFIKTSDLFNSEQKLSGYRPPSS